MALVKLSNITHDYSKHGLYSSSLLPAVNDVSLDIGAKETYGLVGESGCGKSTLGKIAVGLLPPDSGRVCLLDQVLYENSSKSKIPSSLAGRVQMIFQDPFSSLNPKRSILSSVSEPLYNTNQHLTKKDITEQAVAILESVGISSEHIKRYPHEFSGGQRQRIAIARALITNPSFVVCDEPTSSLDSSVQAQVLSILDEMKGKFDVSYLFISHDLSIIRYISDKVAVMFRGQIVEIASKLELFSEPWHPYTKLLFSFMPNSFHQSSVNSYDSDSKLQGSQILNKSTKSFGNKSSINKSEELGCLYYDKCPHGKDECLLAPVPLLDINGRKVRCILYS